MNRGDVLLVSEVVDRLEETDAKVRVIVIDACRNEPFTRSWRRTRGGKSTRGFAPVGQERTAAGTFLAFSSRQGEEALDRVRGYTTGPYAAALAQRIQAPNRDIRGVFGRIGSDVRRITRQAQFPEYRDALDGDFFFKRVRIPPPAPPPPPPTVASPDQRGPTPVSPPPARRPPVPRATPASSQKPAWADKTGQDKYGLYAEVVIPGSKARFRMRFIEPGTFMMGSSGDDPEVVQRRTAAT